MPRIKSAVQETIEALKALESQHKDSPREVRVRMLRLLRENPTYTLAEISSLINCSERSVQRWWERYNKGGIESMLDIQKRGRKRGHQVSATILQSLREKLATDGFDELKHAQEWLRDTHGIEYSRSSVWKLLKSEGAESSRWVTATNQENAVSTPMRKSLAVEGSRVPPQMVEFLNSLPTTADVVEWIKAFREGLVKLLGDVDHISLTIDRNCDLQNPETYRPQTLVTEHIAAASPGLNGSVVVVETDEQPAIRHLNAFKRQRQDLDKFHPPVYFDYYYKGSAYLASMFLWRFVEKEPIAEATIQLVKDLEPFLNFAFSDIVARNKQQNPIDDVFNDAFNRMTEDGDLSSQERRIAILRLLGHSYKEMADVVLLSIDTVKKHMTQIHKKTHTRSQSELFAKYFTGRYSVGDGRDD